jgi:effector-binding domain-containing protein
MSSVEVLRVPERVTAVVRSKTDFANLAKTIGRSIDKVYAFLPSVEAKPWGHNIVLYRDREMNVEVGVEVARRFEGDGEVVCSVLPAGEVARTVHVGPYFEMRKGYELLEAWLAANRPAARGPRWEVYGDWVDDPDKLETEIYAWLGP